MRTVEDRLGDLLDRQAIEELIVRRGRAADAKDPDAIVACHVPRSIDRHGFFDGTIEDFAEYLRANHYANSQYGRQRHFVANIVIDLEPPDSARAESLHVAVHELHLDGGRMVAVIGGRYLDQLRRHDGSWRLLQRQLVYDWSYSYDQDDPHVPAPLGLLTEEDGS